MFSFSVLLGAESYPFGKAGREIKINQNTEARRDLNVVLYRLDCQPPVEVLSFTSLLLPLREQGSKLHFQNQQRGNFGIECNYDCMDLAA